MAHHWSPISFDDTHDATRRLLFLLLRHRFGGADGLGLLTQYVVVLFLFIRISGIVVLECCWRLVSEAKNLERMRYTLLIDDLVSLHAPLGLIEDLDYDHVAMHSAVEVFTAYEQDWLRESRDRHGSLKVVVRARVEMSLVKFPG